MYKNGVGPPPHTCTYIHTCTHIHTCTYTHTYTQTYTHTYMYIYTYMYIHTYMCTYIHVHTYIHVERERWVSDNFINPHNDQPYQIITLRYWFRRLNCPQFLRLIKCSNYVVCSLLDVRIVHRTDCYCPAE